uniref:DNA-directed DNA polymerase n=1 Tax=Tetranychus urticae TaxID=32264 RepID=T1KX63_TETUR
MITNTWTSEELKTAVRYGYRIIKIYQVLQFERNADLFSEYIKIIAKLMLNSLWGKFAQNSNLTKTSIMR